MLILCCGPSKLSACFATQSEKVEVCQQDRRCTMAMSLDATVAVVRTHPPRDLRVRPETEASKAGREVH
jgi:hypothetical protein